MPISKDAKSKGQKAHIAVDKLYIEGKLYTKSGSTNTANAEKPSGTHSSQKSNSVPQPEGVRGFSVLQNEEEA